MWVLGPEPGSFARTTCALNIYAVSPGLGVAYKVTGFVMAFSYLLVIALSQLLLSKPVFLTDTCCLEESTF